ncbi:MAG: octaprenyl diphosphate synthase [Deltaproteobacteria bacterium]|nr:MAG: octaprenyl diphosphate synthase [Deltaproteobacteria bacterium]
MEIDKIFALAEREMEAVEGEFEKNLDSEISLIPVIGKYILDSGGKRMRPLFLILSSKLAGYEGPNAVPLAAIMEFIHTATLLHDDVVDNAHMRRGQEAAHVIWGNSAAVLVGDFLFSKSFKLLTSHGSTEILRAVSAATTAIAEGEVLQLVKTCDIGLTEDEYLRVVINKTAMLLAAPCQVGGLLGNLPESHVAALYNFGLELGVSIQIIDDCLDYAADEETFGKKRGTDLAEGKITMPLIYVLRVGSDEERERIEEIINRDELQDGDLDYVLGLIDKYDAIAWSKGRAAELVAKAKGYLDIFEPGVYRDALCGLADYTVTRHL